MGSGFQRQTQMDRSTLLILSFNGITTGIWSASATAREPTNWNLEPIASGSGKLNPKKISSGKGGRKYSLHPPSGSRFCDRELVLHKRTWFRQRWCARSRMHDWFSALVQMLLHSHLLSEQAVRRRKSSSGCSAFIMSVTVAAPGEEVLDSVCEPRLPV